MNFMKNLLNYVCNTFGFSDFSNDFLNSLIHFKFLLFTLPSSLIIFGFVEKIFGVSAAIFGSFIALAILELVTGLTASRIKKIKWESKKIGRFGLKILVWLTLIGVAHSFVLGYSQLQGLQNALVYQLFSWLHGVLIVYVSFEYLISVMENLAVITGQSNNKLLSFIKRKFDGFLGESDLPKTDVKPKKNTDHSGAEPYDNCTDGDCGDGGDGGGDAH